LLAVVVELSHAASAASAAATIKKRMAFSFDAFSRA
jgi:hypothetical protein